MDKLVRQSEFLNAERKKKIGKNGLFVYFKLIRQKSFIFCMQNIKVIKCVESIFSKRITPKSYHYHSPTLTSTYDILEILANVTFDDLERIFTDTSHDRLRTVFRVFFSNTHTRLF